MGIHDEKAGVHKRVNHQAFLLPLDQSLLKMLQVWKGKDSMKKRKCFWVLGCCIFWMTIFSGCADTASNINTNANEANAECQNQTYHPQMPANIHTIRDAIKDLNEVLGSVTEKEGNMGAIISSEYFYRNNLQDLSHSQILEGFVGPGPDCTATWDPGSVVKGVVFNNMTRIAAMEDRLEISSRLFILYSDLPCCQIEVTCPGHIGFGSDYGVIIFLPTFNGAKRVADDLFSIQQQFKTCSYKEKATREAARFEAMAKEYREQAIKPAISEEQRKYIVQANLLTKQKNYMGAIELYRKAIAENPVAYPEAYSNMALLFAQDGYYQHAINQMKKYLMLVPDAKDARSAQDKIYEWELQMKKQE